MKAWEVRDKYGECSTVVFAETREKAKSLALQTECCGDSDFCDILVCRIPGLDKYYKDGKLEMYWDNPEDRLVLVKEAGFYCVDTYEYEEYCEECIAKDYCREYQSMKDDKE